MRVRAFALLLATAVMAGACSTKTIEVDAAGSTTTTTSGSSSSSTPTPDSSTTSTTSGATSGATAFGARAGQCPSQAEVDGVDAASLDAFAEDPVLLFEQAMAIVGQYVPPELQADFETLVEVGRRQLAVLTEVDTLDPAEMTPEQRQLVDDAVAAPLQPDVLAAAERFEEYFRTACPGVDFGSDDSGSASGPNGTIRD